MTLWRSFDGSMMKHAYLLHQRSRRKPAREPLFCVQKHRPTCRFLGFSSVLPLDIITSTSKAASEIGRTKLTTIKGATDHLAAGHLPAQLSWLVVMNYKLT